jgi:hypothetical protein
MQQLPSSSTKTMMQLRLPWLNTGDTGRGLYRKTLKDFGLRKQTWTFRVLSASVVQFLVLRVSALGDVITKAWRAGSNSDENHAFLSTIPGRLGRMGLRAQFFLGGFEVLHF